MAGWLVGWLGWCPVVKRIWTPSWVLFSGGWCFLLLSGFHLLLDRAWWKGWATPLLVIGANSIAAYCIAHLWEDFVRDSYKTHLGQSVFQVFGAKYEPVVQGAAILLAFWLILLWMQRRRIFLRNPEVIETLGKALATALKDPTVVAFFKRTGFGLLAEPPTPRSFTLLANQNVDVFSKLIRDAKLDVE